MIYFKIKNYSKKKQTVQLNNNLKNYSKNSFHHSPNDNIYNIILTKIYNKQWIRKYTN
jgi:hypothetical protein